MRWVKNILGQQEKIFAVFLVFAGNKFVWPARYLSELKICQVPPEKKVTAFA